MSCSITYTVFLSCKMNKEINTPFRSGQEALSKIDERRRSEEQVVVSTEQIHSSIFTAAGYTQMEVILTHVCSKAAQKFVFIHMLTSSSNMRGKSTAFMSCSSASCSNDLSPIFRGLQDFANHSFSHVKYPSIACQSPMTRWKVVLTKSLISALKKKSFCRLLARRWHFLRAASNTIQ